MTASGRLMLRERALVVALASAFVAGCTMFNPEFGQSEGEEIADESESADAGMTTTSESSSTTMTSASTLDESESADTTDAAEAPTDERGDEPCPANQEFCEGECVFTGTQEHCEGCEPCEQGSCRGQVCHKDHVMFVTSIGFTGALEDLDGADEACEFLAFDLGAEVPFGEYVAWLGTDDYSSAEEFGLGSRFVRPDGMLVAESLDDLLDGQLQNPLIVTELGTMLEGAACAESVMVWTGLTGAGQSQADNCSNWTSEMDVGTVGSAVLTTEGWTEAEQCEGGTRPCEKDARLYCIHMPGN